MKRILKEPIFWTGVALVTFAYFVAEDDSTGVNNLLTIGAIGGGAALVILAIKKPA